MIELTIFTPTYNRLNTIKRLYESLLKQTTFEFEWVVVDDGSSDSTDHFFEEITKTSPFSITYVRQNNFGKHVAINKGVELAKGRLFFIVDSDDYLVETAIDQIYKIDNSIMDKSNFCGFSGVRVRPDGSLIGKTFKKEYIDCTALEREKNGIIGDKSEIYYTSVLKKYPFPYFENEKFLTESVVWYRMANDGWLIRWTNEKFYVCDYLIDGLSHTTGKCSKNFNGYTLSVSEYLKYKNISFLKLFKTKLSYSAIAIKEKKDLKLCSKKTGISLFFMHTFGRFGYIAFKFLAKIKNNGK